MAPSPSRAIIAEGNDEAEYGVKMGLRGVDAIQIKRNISYDLSMQMEGVGGYKFDKCYGTNWIKITPSERISCANFHHHQWQRGGA